MPGSNVIDWVQRNLNAFVRKGKAPGIQYLALDLEKTLCRYQCGLADILRQAPMDAATTMMAYSMSKPITAATVLQLVDAHRVGLEDSIDRYVKPPDSIA